ncbi:MAG: DUF4197 domain-containing protein [Bacteroidales bacterium]|nr:DUF4197 domain-containing protein [Bacteroidales bacterium]
MKRLIVFAFLVFSLTSCDVLQQVASEIDPVGLPVPTSNPLTESEVISGLKDALRVSTDTAVSGLSALNGFFGDAALKILLPPDAKIITDNLDNPVLKAVGISQKVDDVILRMNRSAEEAAKKATPIFVDAIRNMSIADAFGILKGSDTAATHYFRVSTYNALYQQFKPIITQHLDKDIVGSISTNEAWNTLTTAYNRAARLSSSLTPVNTQLDDYVTKKAIHGVFVKVAEQEAQIRKDPVARVTDILKRVFGS